ncbi:ABC transporter substrate-binding protein [Oceanivirga miroungae]|uniref:NMT1/THI5 like domain-containing protein n=1 Tax=Oceanivirga miroungae TaxID=1130046 RepID=A0A6I8M7A3_9FUSO|nr:ABC transporter substrate-binding protein [Oceanivirga miroungae]VWL85296.1 NMT1/THI5 like domain-containing protein [Oceanivirga miroungae]
MKKILTILILIISSLTFSSDLKEVTFALDWTPNTNHTGIYVASYNGYFKKRGLKVNIVQPGDESNAVIVGTGKAEFSIYFQPNMLGKLKKGVPIKAIAAVIKDNTAGIMVLKNKNTKSPKDLKNMRYASWMDPIDDKTVEDVIGAKPNILPFGDVYDPVTIMKNNIFDYLIVYYAWDGINAKIKNVPVDFYFLKDYNKDLNYYSPVLITSDNLIKNDPKLVQDFLDAAKEGYEFAIKYPEKAAEIFVKMVPESDEKLILESQKWISKKYNPSGKWGEIDINRWDNFYNWVYKNKLTDKKVPSSYGVTNEFIK